MAYLMKNGDACQLPKKWTDVLETRVSAMVSYPELPEDRLLVRRWRLQPEYDVTCVYLIIKTQWNFMMLS